MINLKTVLRVNWLILMSCLSLPVHAADLVDIYELARQQDPRLQQAEAAHAAQLEARPQSRALLLPTVSAAANTTDNDQDRTFENPAFGGEEGFNSHGYSLSLTQPIYHHDRFVQLKQAGKRVRQADAQLNAAQQDVIVRVAERYFDVLAAEDTLEFARAEKNAIQRQLEQTKQQFEVGLIAITDVHEAQASYDLAVAREIEAENRLADAREALSELTGRDHRHLRPLREKVPLISPDPEDMQQWTETALAENPQLTAVRYASEVAQQEVARQRSGHYPTVDVVVNNSKSISGGGSLGGSEIDSTSVSLELNVPLFEGGLVVSQTREAQQRFIEAQEVLEEQRRATIRQARESYRGVKADISRVRALQQAVVSNTSRLEATEAGLEVGTRTTVDVLDARRELFRARRDYARARYDYILNTLRLKEAAGILAAADLGKINKWLE